jgi:hypothetical protein
MDQKSIEMNNLRVLHDYLNQTIDILVRGQRLGGQASGLPFSSFGGTIPGAPIGAGVDVVYGPAGAGWTGSPLFGGVSHAPYQATNPFTGLPVYGQGYVDPFVAQRGLGISGGAFGSWQQPWGPFAEATRQATVAQALAAKQSVFEAMCRVCGIPV